MQEQNFNPKIVGKRKGVRPPGFEPLIGFLEMFNKLRGVEILRPRGVFKFKTFEEADKWWEENTKVKIKPQGHQS
ncbi:MAG: hypothetical protein ACYCVD_12435 [Desulfitobacteriaceae bacterium]